jgi:hydroxymethylpyrimidine pyrophosphatase-like HAD family hydrolase
MQFSIMEIISIIGLIITLCSFGGAVVYNLLKSRFISPDQCKEIQGMCRAHTCHKIESVRNQVVGLANELKEGREASEVKRDAARKEYSEKIEKIYRLIEQTEHDRAEQLQATHLFMGEVRADLKTLKGKMP